METHRLRHSSGDVTAVTKSENGCFAQVWLVSAARHDNKPRADSSGESLAVPLRALTDRLKASYSRNLAESTGRA